MPHDPNSKRLTSRDHAMIESLVLADLAKHGPSLFSAIRTRLEHRMADSLARAALKVLAERGWVFYKDRRFTEMRIVCGVQRRSTFWAREYVAVKGRKPARPRQIVSKPQSAKTLDAKRAKWDAKVALVLADVGTHGPCRFREITMRMNGQVSEIDVRRILNALAGEGRIRVEERAFEQPILHGEGRRATKFRANIYSVAEE